MERERKHRGCETDFIIVGSGPGGAPIANRLTEDPNIHVTVVEGGRPDDLLPDQLLPLDTPNPIPNKITNPWTRTIRGGGPTYALLHRVGFISWEHISWLRDPNIVPRTVNRGIWSPKGSSAGGSTTHHFTVHIRGSPQIYNRWLTEFGNVGWSYDDLLPFFIKSENRTLINTNISRVPIGIPDENGRFTIPGPPDNRYFSPLFPPSYEGGFDTENFGTDGPIPLVRPYYTDPVAAAFRVAANLTLGLPIGVNFDFPATQIGISYQPFSMFDQFDPNFPDINPYPDPYVFPNEFGLAQIGIGGTVANYQRVTSANVYLYPIQNTRPNLKILYEKLATKILFDENKRAIGIRYLDGWNIYGTGRGINTSNKGLGGTPCEAKCNARLTKEKCGYKYLYARKEVILCGGAYNSPQLLMLSGIGPAKHLREHGIKVLVNSPGVGKNLQDHAEYDVTVRTAETFNPFLYIAANAIFPEAFPQTGLFPGLILTTMKYSIDGQDYPNFHAHLYAGGFSTGEPGGGLFDAGLALGDDGLPGAAPYVGPPQYIKPKDEIAGTPEAASITPELAKCNLSVSNHVSALVEELADFTSRGYVQLVSKNPTDPIRVIGNYVITEHDQEAHFRNFRDWIYPFFVSLRDNPQTHYKEGGPTGEPFNLPVSTVPGGEGFFAAWVAPAESQFLRDGQINREAFINYLLGRLWSHHVAGTCRMACRSIDPEAVVDNRGRVYGVTGLRVADASIAPIVANSNTAPMAYVIGERIAAFIKEDL